MSISAILLLVHDSLEERDEAVKALQPGDSMAIIGYRSLGTLDAVVEEYATAYPKVEIEYAFLRPEEDCEYCLFLRKRTYYEEALLREEANDD